MRSKQTYTATPDMPHPKDACQTPPYAIKPLLDYIKPCWRIWEPAAGKGNLVRAFNYLGFSIIGTDILTNQNFFRIVLKQFDCIVTNPPYGISVKYAFIEKCYKHGKPFALLMSAETYFSGTLQKFERQYGGIELIRFDKRINFEMPIIGADGSNATFPTAWFTFGLGIGRQVTSVELDRNFLSDVL